MYIYIYMVKYIDMYIYHFIMNVIIFNTNFQIKYK